MKGLLRSAMTVILTLVWACGSGGTGGTSDVIGGPDGTTGSVIVETEVSTHQVDVGADVTVTCTVTRDGQPIQAAVNIVVGGTTQYVIDGEKVSFDQAGEYTVACEASDMGITDDTPETIEVGADRAVAIETDLDPASIAAGSTAIVTCAATNAMGNPVAVVAAVDVSPSEGVQTTEGDKAGTFTLKATKTGSYEVACRSVDGSLKDDTPATLTVTAAALATVTTTLDPETIIADGEATVSCAAFDEFGNPLDIAYKISADEGLTITAAAASGTLTGTIAGTYEVTCAPADDSPAELESATLTIEAGEAVKLTLGLVPDKPTYSVMNHVQVTWTLADKYDNPVTGGVVDPIAVDPTTGITNDGDGKFTFDVEGIYTFSTCVAGDPGMCDDVQAVCDGTAPDLVITYPERGATLTGAADIVVTGTVSDAISTNQSLLINETQVPIEADGSFQFTMSSSQGMNIIDATASDQWGNTGRVLQSYLFSDTWRPMDPSDPDGSMVPYAVTTYLDDKLFYNADPADDATISALLGMVLSGLDLMSIVPSPLTQVDQAGCKYDAYMTSASYGPPTVELKSTTGGLSMNAVLPNLKMDILLDKTGGGFWCPGDTVAHATADKVTIGTIITIAVNPDTHELNLAAGTSQIALDGFDLSVDSWFNFLLGLFKGTIEDMLKTEFNKQIASLIESLNGALADALSNPIDLPIAPLIPGMNPVTLSIGLQPQTADFTTEGGNVDLNAAITGPKLVERTILGSIGRAACLTGGQDWFTLDTTDPEKIQLAAFDDLINELLYSLWNQKGLHLHITAAELADMGVDVSQYGVSGLDLTTAPLLPPVLTDCPGDLTLQVGDFYADVSFDFGGPVVLGMYVFIEMGADLLVVDDPEKGPSIGIQVKAPDYVDVTVVSINEERAGQEETFAELFKTLLPMLFESLTDKPITFQVPGINLKGLMGSNGAGGGTGLELPDKDLVLDITQIGHEQGHTHLSAGIHFEDPAPEPQ
ncbi:MAG: hypothetical protein GXP54_08280 [Deltaproteobacteria bacterium]|nr:hypothetical protein [Deltaproteobacteria bacterium]